jgi:hypothetical protein
MQSPSNTYMLIFRETDLASYESLDEAQTREALEVWNAWCDELAGHGRAVDGHRGNPLEPAGTVVQAGPGRRGAEVVDGPFAEAKELVGGYHLVRAASLDEAVEMARGCPLLEHGMTVEVRPVATACHLAKVLGMETMREDETEAETETGRATAGF